MAETFNTLMNTLYVPPFRNAINTGAEQYFDVHVGEGFVRQWQKLKTGEHPEQNEAVFRLTEDIRQIFGFRTLQIDASADVKTLKVLVDGRSFQLSELGSGLAQFVMILVPCLLRRPSYVLIDEPELNLHPSLQLDLLAALEVRAEHGVLFATH